MNSNNEKLQLTKNWVILALVAIIVAVVIIVATNISNGIMNKSRLSAAMQTMKSTATVLAGCQIGGLAIIAPNNGKNPKNAPCFEAEKYVTLDRNSTKDCVYNTVFVSSVSDSIVNGGAIQAGCECTGTTISTCKSIFQCDFATTGKCIENIVVN